MSNIKKLTQGLYQAALDEILSRVNNAKLIIQFRDVFKVDTMDHVGENWLICDCGADEDRKTYIVTTDKIPVSQSGEFLHGAKADAELICELLNDHYRAIAEK